VAQQEEDTWEVRGCLRGGDGRARQGKERKKARLNLASVLPSLLLNLAVRL
jgi:hypothetical protein